MKMSINDLILLMTAGQTVYKWLPKDHAMRKDLATAIRRARAVIKKGGFRK